MAGKILNGEGKTHLSTIRLRALRVPRRERLFRVARSLWDLTPLGASIRDGPVHGGGVWADVLEGCHGVGFGLGVGFFDGGHLFLGLGGLLFAAARSKGGGRGLVRVFWRGLLGGRREGWVCGSATVGHDLGGRVLL